MIEDLDASLKIILITGIIQKFGIGIRVIQHTLIRCGMMLLQGIIQVEQSILLMGIMEIEIAQEMNIRIQQGVDMLTL